MGCVLVNYNLHIYILLFRSNIVHISITDNKWFETYLCLIIITLESIFQRHAVCRLSCPWLYLHNTRHGCWHRGNFTYSPHHNTCSYDQTRHNQWCQNCSEVPQYPWLEHPKIRHTSFRAETTTRSPPESLEEMLSYNCWNAAKTH